MEQCRKIASRNYSNVKLRVIPGHFATANSHINYYVDLSNMKARKSEAEAVAKALSERYVSSTIIDTIVCMDGCEVIGAYLAGYLTDAGVISMNAHQTIYITSPEFSHTGQLLFRENLQHMINGKYVLLLLASATTGRTLTSAVDVIQYYGGKIAGISAIFSATEKIHDYPVNSLFTPNDISDYATYEPADCPLCKEKMPLDAIVNSYGYARL